MIAVIISFAISAVVAGIIGGRGMMGSPSSMNFRAGGGFDKDSPGVDEWTQKMEAGDVENAHKSGESAAQSEAMAKLMAPAVLFLPLLTRHLEGF